MLLMPAPLDPNNLGSIISNWPESLKMIGLMIALFAIYGFLLNKILFAPVSRILETREAAIKGAEKSVEDVRAEESRQTARFEAEMVEARRAAAQEREKLKAEAMRAADSMKEQARNEARAQLDMSRKALAAEIEMAQKNLRADAEKLAGEMLSRVLRRKVA